MDYAIPTLPLSHDMETKKVLLQLNRANRALAELKGIAHLIPNEKILVSMLVLQEARVSSLIENIVTTQDDLYRAGLKPNRDSLSPSTKEVLNYSDALFVGYARIVEHGLLTNRTILSIQERLEKNRAGFRSLPGTVLRRSDGKEVYTPPQDGAEVLRLMCNLEQFINDEELCTYDPLIKLAIIHHQFESIHPFYDGNGRTGRIINVLYLVQQKLLDSPILYLSRYITRNKAEYYRLIQAIRDSSPDNREEWESWLLFILQGIEETANETIILVQGISELMSHYKAKLKTIFGNRYKHDMLNSLFAHPYTKIEFFEKDTGFERKTAAKYLESIVGCGLLRKEKWGRYNYYMNDALVHLFLYD